MGTPQATERHEGIRAAVAVTSAVFGAWRGRCSSLRERAARASDNTRSARSEATEPGCEAVLKAARNGCARTNTAKRVGGH